MDVVTRNAELPARYREKLDGQHDCPHIACLVVGADDTSTVLEEARRLGDPCGARLSVVYVVAPFPAVVSLELLAWQPDWTADAVEEAAEWLGRQLAGIEHAQGFVFDGHPGPVMREWARLARPDVIVVAEPCTWLGRVRYGRPARYLTRHAACPVIVIDMRSARGAVAAPARMPSAVVPTELAGLAPNGPNGGRIGALSARAS